MAKNNEHLKAHAFKKGQSGNPGGRPKKIPELQALFEKICSEEKNGQTAMEAGLRRMFSSWINNGSVEAGRLILQYAYGVPKQNAEASIEVQPPPNITINIPAEVAAKHKRP